MYINATTNLLLVVTVTVKVFLTNFITVRRKMYTDLD